MLRVGGVKPRPSWRVLRIWALVSRQTRGLARVAAVQVPTSTLGGMTGPFGGVLVGTLDPPGIWPVQPRQARAKAADNRNSFIRSSGLRSGPGEDRHYSDTRKPLCLSVPVLPAGSARHSGERLGRHTSAGRGEPT